MNSFVLEPISSRRFSKKFLPGTYELLYSIIGFSTLGSVDAVPWLAVSSELALSIFFVLKNEDVLCPAAVLPASPDSMLRDRLSFYKDCLD